MKKILITLDFSESCKNAINYVKEMISGSEVIVDMMHVYGMPITTMTTVAPDLIGDIKSENENHSKQMLDDHMNLLPAQHQGNIHSVYGVYPSSEIIDKAVEVHADLIVMALRQKFSMIDRFIGTVTAQTISKSPVPVLAVPNGSRYNTASNILFPTEELYKVPISESTNLKTLFDFCGLYDRSNIYMVHIAAEDNKNKFLDHKLLKGLTIFESYATSVEEGVINNVEKNNITTIAIRKKSRVFWERLYHSSLTRKLLFQERLPILIVT